MVLASKDDTITHQQEKLSKQFNYKNIKQWTTGFPVAQRNELLYHINKIEQIQQKLLNLQNSWLETSQTPYPVIKWKDKAAIELTWAPYLNSDPGGFMEIGFSNYGEFYNLKVKDRANFIKRGLDLLSKTFQNNDNVKNPANFLHKSFNFYKQLQELALQYR